MDIVTLGAALNGSAEYVNSHFKSGSNIQIVDNPDGTQTINASGEVSSEDTVARAEIAEIKDGETLDSFGDVETALATKANTSTTYTKTEVDTALSAKANSADVYSKTAVDTALGNKADKSTTYTKTEVDTALSAKADKSTTYTKTEVDTALDDKVDKETGKGLSTNDYTTVEKTKLAGIAEGAEVNEIEGIKVNNTSVNPDANKVINITVPTSAADVSALPDTTKYAVALSLTINSSTFVITGQLKDQNGDNLGTAQLIDLPLESVVVNGSYDSQIKKVVLTLQNGNTIEFSIADLVSGLQTELSASNKLNPAYIDYDSTHRAVSDTEKSEWNGKQNALSSTQLDAVNSGIDSAKVEQIETNKNNISWNTQNGVKNIYKITKVPAVSGVMITKTDANTVSLNGTFSAATYVFFTLSADNVTLPAGDWVVFTKTTGTIPARTLTISNNLASVTLGSYATFSTSETKQIGVYVQFLSNDSVNGSISIMICPKSLYDAEPTYQPYAMSNAELTAKEQTNESNILTYAIPTCTDTAFATSTTGAYVYTGISFTVPSGEVWEFFVADKYNGSGTTNFSNGLLVSDSSGAITNVSVIAENTQVPSVSGISYWTRQLTGLTPKRTNAMTYYVWTNRAVTTSCNIFVCLRRVF